MAAEKRMPKNKALRSYAFESVFENGSKVPVSTTVHGFEDARTRDAWVARAPGVKKRRETRAAAVEVKRMPATASAAQAECSRRRNGIVAHRSTT